MKTPKFITIKKAEVFYDKWGNPVPYPEIIRTWDYEWLKTLPQNRLISRSAVKKLARSVTQFGMLRPVILICINYVYYKGDGNHLSTHLVEAGLPIDAYVVRANSVEETMELIATLNNSGRGWSLTQYIKSWSFFNNVYEKLIDLKKKYNIGYSLLGALLLQTTQYEAKKAIKNGTFEERADPKRITRLLDYMYNIEMKTGISMKHTHTAAGLATFIIKLGLDEYGSVESKFIHKINEHNKKNPIPIFARQSDSEELWSRIYHSL